MSRYVDCQVFLSVFSSTFSLSFRVYSPFDPTYNLVERIMMRLGNRGLKVVGFGVTFPPSE